MHLLSVASLKNRALIALITICVAVFGGVALANLKVELVPDITLPQVVVVTSQPGSSPEVVDSDITTHIENAIQSVPGLESTTGTSSSGSSVVNASFTYGTDLATTEQKVQQALNRITQLLPEGVTPTVMTGSIADFPVVQLAVTGGSLDEATLVDRIDELVLPKIERLDGVREATVSGAEGSRVTITPDVAALAAAGLSSQAISDAIDQNGTLIPGGTVDSDGQTLSVQSGTRIASVDEIAQLPLIGSAEPVTIGDVATVALEADPAASISIVNGERALTIGITKTTDANTVAVSQLIAELLPRLESDLGDDAAITVVFDQAPFISQSIDALATEGLLGLAFAVVVILIFLLSVRSTLVTAISIPASVLMTFIGLWATGYSMNILTLGALTIAIGRVVDDSIVVIENIRRHLPLHRNRGRAILEAVREVAGAVTASTVTTVIVFLPLAFVGDITGELFRPFAITVTIALLSSLLVSLTIVPVLAYWLLRTRQAEREAADRPDRLRRAYLPILTATMRHPAIVLVGAVLVLGGSVAVAPLMATNFLGDTGQSTVRATQTLESSASLDSQLQAATDATTALEQVDGVDVVQATVSQAGGSASSGFTGGGGGGISYSITAADDADMEQVTADVSDALSAQPGEIELQQDSALGGGDIEIDVTAASDADLETATTTVADAVGDVGDVAQTVSSLTEAQPLIQVTVDRDAAAQAGLSETMVAGLVAQSMTPRPIGDVQLDGSVVTIYVATETPATTIDELRALQLPSAAGLVTLDDVANVDESTGPATITTADGVRSATVTVTPAGDDVGAVSGAVSDAVADAELPAGAEAAIGGVATQMTDALTQLGIAALIAVLLVYVVMVATFKSLLQPFMLLVSVPFAATGAILMQLITGVPLGVASMIGVLMLVGIVVTNAIVLIDLVNQYRDRGLGVREAIVEGAQRRLRPILMTAAATVFALIPMAAGITGHGGFISQPLAIVVIGGLLSSTVLTLIVLPVLYLAVEGTLERRRVRRGGAMRHEQHDDLLAADGDGEPGDGRGEHGRHAPTHA